MCNYKCTGDLISEKRYRDYKTEGEGRKRKRVPSGKITTFGRCSYSVLVDNKSNNHQCPRCGSIMEEFNG